MVWSRHLLLPAMLGIGIVLSFSPRLEAQKGGGGRSAPSGGARPSAPSGGARPSAPSGGSMSRGSVPHTGSPSMHHPGSSGHYNHSSGYYNHSHNYYPYFSGSIYLSPFGYGSYDPYYRSYYYPPTYYDAPSYYSVSPSYNAVPPMLPADPVDQPAYIEVRLPVADAQVFLDGNKTTSTGMQRAYNSPALAPGEYSYEVTAVWQQDGQDVRVSRTIRVAPGRTSLADFTKVNTKDKLPQDQ